MHVPRPPLQLTRGTQETALHRPFRGSGPLRPSLHWAAEQVWWPIAMVAPARHTPGSLAPAPVGNSVLKEPPIHLVLT